MQPQRRSSPLLLFAIVAASACTEPSSPTTIPDGLEATFAAGPNSNAPKVKVKAMQLASNTLRIDGPSVTGSVSIGNSGLAIQENVFLKAEITQGSASKVALNTPMQCSTAPGEAGKLPNGSCNMTFTTSASNASGSGTLVPGAAMFTLRVVETSATGDTELASKNLQVNLVAAPSMTVTVAPTAVLIDGTPSTATIVIQNPANGLQGMSVQGWIVQGSAPNQTRRPTGGSLLMCGANTGVLPAGTCTTTVSVAPSNVGPGNGLFASGAGTFELELRQTSGSTTTTLLVATAPVTLVWGSPHITRVVLESTTLQIGGAAVGLTADIQNGGPAQSGVVLNTQVHQFLNGHVVKGAGGMGLECGGAPGDLPTTGTGVCTLQFPVNALGGWDGGSLVPGDAVLFVDLITQPGVVHRERINITLTAAEPPTITSIDLSAQSVLIGEGLPYTATFTNPTGAAITNVGIQGYLTQGDIEDFGAGGTTLTCPDVPNGTLPTGTCTISFGLNTANTSGTPNWQPGPATFRLELFSGSTLLATKSVTVFLNIIQ